MSGHEVTIGDASVTFEQVEVELDYNDILLNIEDTIYERITDQINDEAWDAVSIQVDDCIGEHFEDFEESVWSAISRLDSAETDNNSWAGAAREYLLSMSPKDASSEAWVAAAKGAPPEYGYVRVRAIVREELATVLSAFAKAVNAQLGAEITVAPGD